MSIGSKIKALRRAKDLTQEELAELRDAFSHYAMTKFGVAAFVVLTYLFAKNAKRMSLKNQWTSLSFES